ncbi:MAG TPA: aminodeoxychorismate lyase [Gammaproteobacteria bacterium]|nr:aminodeoxychorismate lyase [Gammaproteobacteria bacterium]
MNTRCWINGEPGAQVAVDDRGLQYGDGLFETLAVRQGRVALLEYHLQRLARGCARLLLQALPLDLIREEIIAAAQDQQRAVLKLIVTRGVGERGYRPSRTAQPTRILMRYDWPDHPHTWQQYGIRTRICKTALGSNPQLAGLKHLNRLEQILARAEWSDTDDIQEGLMLDADGSVIEGTMTNVFARLAGGEWITPDLSCCGVTGVMRRYLLEQMQQAGIAVQVGKLAVAGLQTARELFVCNSIIGVWPARQVDDWHYEVGEMTREAQQWVEQA